MFSWMEALAALEDGSKDKDDEESPDVRGLSGLPVGSPLKPPEAQPAGRVGGSSYAAMLPTQKPVAAPEGRVGERSPSGVRLSGVGDEGWAPAALAPKIPDLPGSGLPSGLKAFEPMTSPQFGVLPEMAPPQPLVFEDLQRIDPGPMMKPPPDLQYGMPDQSFGAPQQNAGFPQMTPPPAMPEAPKPPAPLEFGVKMPTMPGLEGLYLGGNQSTSGTGTSSSTGTGSSSSTGTGASATSGTNSDFNKAMQAMGLAQPAMNYVNNLMKSPPAQGQAPKPTAGPEQLGPPAPTSEYVDPMGEWSGFLPGPGETPQPSWGGIDPMGEYTAPQTSSESPTPTTTPSGSGGSLVGQAVEAALGPEAGKIVNQAIPYVGAVLAAALGLSQGKPPEEAVLSALPSLMQSPAVKELIGSAVTSMLGAEAAGMVGSALPYAGAVFGLAMGLAGGQDPGTAVLNTAIGVAAAALAPETAGLSVVVGALLQYLLGGIGGPSEAWQKFGGKVQETNKTNIAAVDALVPAIVGAKTVEELEAARAQYINAVYGGKLDPETGQPMTFTPQGGEYLPGIPGATGTAHEWGKTFNPNELNAALNQLYGTKLTSLTQGLGDPNAALQYLTQILPIIQHGATGAGGNPGAMPTLYGELTPAGPNLPPLTPPPPEPVQTAGTEWTGSA